MMALRLNGQSPEEVNESKYLGSILWKHEGRNKRGRALQSRKVVRSLASMSTEVKWYFEIA